MLGFIAQGLLLYAQADTERNVEFDIHVQAIVKGSGNLVVAVFDCAEKFLSDETLIKLYIPVRQPGDMRIPVTALPPGTYAIALFHDVDGDNQLDKNWIGIPSEPIGFSRNARGWMGPPKFADAAFVHAGQHHTLEITLY